MSFKVLFMAHAPDANYQEHHTQINTGLYQLSSYVVRTQVEALQVAKSVHKKEILDAIILCPGFTHRDVTEIFDALNGQVSVNIARGDGPSSRIAKQARDRTYT